jgi:hypothetical protein
MSNKGRPPLNGPLVSFASVALREPDVRGWHSKLRPDDRPGVHIAVCPEKQPFMSAFQIPLSRGEQ